MGLGDEDGAAAGGVDTVARRPVWARTLVAVLCLAAVVCAVVVTIGGISKTNRSVDLLTSSTTKQASLAEYKFNQCLGKVLRQRIPHGSKVFVSSGFILFQHRIPELLTPGYKIVDDKSKADYGVYLRAGTTCMAYQVVVTREPQP